MAAAKKGLWGWVQDVGKTCGFAQQPQQPPMWVRANPELFPQEVPGMGEELLTQVSTVGGSLEEKIQCVIDTFRCSARHLESLQQVLRKRALERRDREGAEPFPAQVEEVIAEGNYLESFLEAFDGQSFLLFSEEIVPSHEYRLALEVHTGGAYWSSIPVQDAGSVRHKVETVGASSPAEGSASIISQFGAAQRGAVFVWRWQHLLDQGPYNLPEWLAKALNAEGNDPLRKLQGELETMRRWEQQVRQDTAQHVKAGTEIKDPYIKEVLRLWPSESDAQGEQLKKCAWVEGLDPRLFVGRTVLVHRIPYDGSHALQLHATISRRHTEEPPQESNPPYRLTTSWHWSAAGPGGAAGRTGGSAARESQEPAPITRTGTSLSELSRPGTAASDLTRPGTAYSELTRPGTAYSELARPGSSAGILAGGRAQSLSGYSDK
eukprot:CAMPEP_0179074654 /NCGR_PEP_ID=MMETSP0796-20121207/33195_1 /TAXON_ID=73915 /ORGANISM="Pyrodinium bahamense, Strain pbaha01" /LENGTH=434 /DNA_ID=CAMNT_0020771879 /DNA_START=62 /DNA_END=1366 /DNA_ORIENTATION=+